ncbi:cupredoxin domain-containing protein [Olivibacter sp. SDN3]|uniref:plastocyanin/azurin family copper-binding protein n=1 Tax=Olivibacter sp. SDN3 TaxID=2764720 RepID=UPI00165156EF|nr:plastocyanin/azurin family copper-binding protein [Olivibacter sp. SDN3]QNL51477.1 cupredoxin domain-containing protein [Olivibacter sp. SDN3]
MKKVFMVPAIAAALFLASCGGGDSGSSANHEHESAASTSTEAPAATVPGIEDVELTDHIELEGSDDMRFDKDLFKVKAGETVKLKLKNVGVQPVESMGHNAVVLDEGTDVASFGGEAFKAKDEEYIPSTFASSIIAHTKLLGPGESDEIEFTLPKAGVYEFICSFPGHWGTMRGKIVAE